VVTVPMEMAAESRWLWRVKIKITAMERKGRLVARAAASNTGSLSNTVIECYPLKR
jgi:hypothetical protein